MLKQCPECGKYFEAVNPRYRYCDNPHYRTCVVCGTKFLLTKNQLSSNIQTCSKQCRRVLISTASKARRYTCTCSICGRIFEGGSPDAKICKYPHVSICPVCGKEFVQLNNEHPRKTCSDTCRYKLSKESYMKNSDTHTAYRKLQMLKKYGVDNPMKVPEFQQKSKETCLRKYGKTAFCQTPEFITKCIETNRDRYGVDWHAQTDEHKQAIKQTSLQRYGVTNPSKSQDVIRGFMTDETKLPVLMKFRENPAKFIKTNFDTSPTLHQLSQLCGIRESSVGDILVKSGDKDLVALKSSYMETEVVDYLSNWIPSTAIIQNTRKIITPLELDIYLPDYNFAIECNPTATHNSTTCLFPEYNDTPKSWTYHKNKTDVCAAKGVFLFHIFGYEWTHKKDIIESMIANILNVSTTKLYARNTSCIEISAKSCFEFCQRNHRQGGVYTKINMGLLYKGELVSVMSFNKRRNTIGSMKDAEYELVRFCSKQNIRVIGGASKLFKHFIQSYDPGSVVSFSDRAHTRGNLYEQLNFTKIRESDPGYVWVDVKTDIAYSRINAQKQNICKFLNDDTLDLTLSERELMSSHGFVQVFDSGTITWIWKGGNI